MQPVWMNAQILKLIKSKRRRRAWKKFKETNSHHDHTVYKEKEKSVKSLIRKAKFSHERSIARNSKMNPKAFYAYVKQNRDFRDSIGPLKNENGEIISDDAAQATIFNQLFSSVLTPENLSEISEPSIPAFAPVMETPIFTPENIRKKIDALKPNTSPGQDGITSRILKAMVNEVSLPLSLIFQQSLAQGQVPSDWRQAIFKKGLKSEAGNYRPISLTSIVCKLMESLLKDTMVDHLNNHTLLQPS